MGGLARLGRLRRRALTLARVVWGFVGGGYARFAQFVRAPRVVLAYLGAIARGSEARFVGHNPAGGAMIVALLIVVAATVASGYALTTDALWGSSGRAAAAFVGSRTGWRCSSSPISPASRWRACATARTSCGR